MTLMTIIKVMTPTLTPAMEIMEIRLMKRFLRLLRKYRRATKASNFKGNSYKKGIVIIFVVVEIE